MGGDAVGLLEEDEFGDVLVAVVGVEEVVSAAALEDERSRRDRLRRIPAEHEVDCVVGSGIEPLDADVAIIDEAMVGVGDATHRLDVFDAPPHAVELHHDVRSTALPQDGAVLGVVSDLPKHIFTLYTLNLKGTESSNLSIDIKYHKGCDISQRPFHVCTNAIYREYPLKRPYAFHISRWMT